MDATEVVLEFFDDSRFPTQKAPTPLNPQPKPNYVAAALVVVLGVIAAIMILRLPVLSSSWQQNYNPMGHWLLSALVAAIPVVVLLGSLGLV
jgi:hypothetical protein